MQNTVTNGVRRSPRQRFSSTGLLRAVHDETGMRSEFEHDALAQWVKVKTQGPGWSQAQVETLLRDGAGRLLESGAGEGAAYRGRERLMWDANGRLLVRALAQGQLQRYGYDLEGRLSARDLVAGAVQISEQQEFDDQGRLKTLRTGQGPALTLQYDETGRPASAVDALGREHRPRLRIAAEAVPSPRQLKDDWGRVVKTLSADAGWRVQGFDAADRLSFNLDALGQRAHYRYDTAGRIEEQEVWSANAKAPVLTRWRYQGRRLVSLEHPSQREHYAYDARGLLIAKTIKRPDLGAAWAAVSRYEYDAQGQLQAQSLPDGSWLVLRRDGQGRVLALERERLRGSWLAALLPTQVLARDVQRDAVGLSRYVAGNGLINEWLRSREGVLAKVRVHGGREPGKAEQAERYAALLGMGSARAAPAPTPASEPTLPSDGWRKVFAGASPPGALMDKRYLWDAAGNLLVQSERGQALQGLASHAYDQRDRLIASASSRLGIQRWAYDAASRRVLQQSAQPDAKELQAGTQALKYQEGTHRWLGSDGSLAAEYDATGMPHQLRLPVGPRRLQWDAHGRLMGVTLPDGKLAASFRYSHRGERIATDHEGVRQHFLHDEQRRVVAELDSQGKVRRQIVYLGDLPLAFIEHAQAAPVSTEPSAWQVLRRAWRDWADGGERIVWLHSNHLGAVEAASDDRAQLFWQGQYDSHGSLRQQQGRLEQPLRLPGQWFDAATGLHHNDQRWYDPERGEYLSPDPLGTPDGPNAYSYVRANPLRYVDPEGLLLFAFDGTGNDETKPAEVSNVVRFRDAYQDKWRYITGPGTKDPESGIEGGLWDVIKSTTGKVRIAKMIEYLNAESDGVDDNTAIDIDVTGFSRGAAQARDFASQVTKLAKGGWYRYKDKDGKEACQKLNFRFMGIWDSVLSTHTGSYDLRIPDEFQHVAHAVALNEYRSLFPLESIVGGKVPEGKTRIERGFLGSHSDIGGSFPEGDLARVAYIWMVDQAKAAGLKMNEPDRHIIASPVLHDESANLFAEDGPKPTASSEDRKVRWQGGGSQKQRTAKMGGMSYPDTEEFIKYDSSPKGIISGKVDMKEYAGWLEKNGYDLKLTVGP